MTRCSLLIFAVVFTFSCSHWTSIEHLAGQRIDNCSENGPCIIRFKDVTDFEWDEMYVFESGATLDRIEKALRTPFPDYVEFTRRLVFLKNGKIVYREDEPTDIERIVQGQLTFAESYSDPHWFFTPESAVFSAQKKQSNGATYYVLTQIK